MIGLVYEHKTPLRITPSCNFYHRPQEGRERKPLLLLSTVDPRITITCEERILWHLCVA